MDRLPQAWDDTQAVIKTVCQHVAAARAAAPGGRARLLGPPILLALPWDVHPATPVPPAVAAKRCGRSGGATPVPVFTPPAVAPRAGSGLSPGLAGCPPPGASCSPGICLELGLQCPWTCPSAPRALLSLVAEPALRPRESQTRGAALCGGGTIHPPWRWPVNCALWASFKDKSPF